MNLTDLCPNCTSFDIIHIAQSYDIVCNFCHYRGREYRLPPPKPTDTFLFSGTHLISTYPSTKIIPDLRTVYSFDITGEPQFDVITGEPSLTFKVISKLRKWSLS